MFSKKLFWKRTGIMQLSLFALLTGLWLATPAMAQKSAGESVDDTWLHTKVKTQLAGYGSTNINIEVYRGEVQLAGFINSENDKNAAIARVEAIEEIAKLHDQLVVVKPKRTPGRTLDDSVLSAKVKSELGNNDLGRAWDINVEVNRGRVLLSGFVGTKDDRDIAISTVESLDGVEDVINGMNIKPGD